MIVHDLYCNVRRALFQLYSGREQVQQFAINDGGIGKLRQQFLTMEIWEGANSWLQCVYFYFQICEKGI